MAALLPVASDPSAILVRHSRKAEVTVTDENKQVVRRGFEEGFNAGDLAVFDELTDVDYIDYEAMEQGRRGPEEVKGVYRWLKAAFPDLRFHIVDMVSEDDKVWTLVVFTGTHEGEFIGDATDGSSLRSPPGAQCTASEMGRPSSIGLFETTPR